MSTEMGSSLPGRDLGGASAAGQQEERSIGEILSDVTTDLSVLMRQELELAKAELKQTATRAGTGAGMFGGAAVAGHMVLLFLSLALWWALGDAVGLGWSAVIVAVIWGIIAAVLAVMGRSQMARVRGMPATAETVGKIPDALQGNEPAHNLNTNQYSGTGMENPR
ncbi:MAG: phage holin family protein [Actinomycetota bacterium]|nr:phage holin family protein [Actinomycetota bacterium]